MVPVIVKSRPEQMVARVRHIRRSLWRSTSIEGSMDDQGEPGHGWTVVLRRRPVRMVDRQPEGGYTDDFKIICCDCGDDPDLDYSQVSPGRRRIRGPYPIAAGVAAYVIHAGRHPREFNNQAISSVRSTAAHSPRARIAATSSGGAESMSTEIAHVGTTRHGLKLVERR
jgi:hypothetical protein